MTWWKCFVCGSDELCNHREPDLIEWKARMHEATAGLPPRKPAARETESSTPDVMRAMRKHRRISRGGPHTKNGYARLLAERNHGSC